ncbi:Crp/Fnr family transcriptional regulator [Echinicola strongylocentroti]|uniref:Crp/Fnr family transcriptional regulator n=1 Tax=Echinicola strongylocentroti TaxID=1795355 RepID=A0A2Z4IIJ7_9BACT|nr:Crp/Fnr family transcriptional regulator [Echinicola strongylocentroti]AWW30951.1 Crp/Fnr family transcriptional regulator [Echinicola strongylocentroti]
MEQIRHFFEAQVPLSDADWNIFRERLTSRVFTAKSCVLSLGQVENHLSFIERGMVRYFVPGDEHEMTFGFSFEGEFMSAYDSFLTKMPSGYSIETLGETKLWRISYEGLQEVYRLSDAGERIGRCAAEGLFLKKAKRELALLQQTAEERYLDLFVDRPELFQQIPLKYLASYIGVTPQALSRIRKRIVQRRVL